MQTVEKNAEPLKTSTVKSATCLICLILSAALLTSGCGDDAESSNTELAVQDDAGQNNSPGDDAGADADGEPVERELGPCAELVSGENSITSAGMERTFLLDLPENPEGAPVVFAWHWWGGSAAQIRLAINAQGLASTEGAIVVMPESKDSLYEWRFSEAPDGNPDLILFEDLVECMDVQLGANMDRVHSTGHSAGGLWTSYLLMHAADKLASTASISGGATAQTYVTPQRNIPALVMWGGPSDQLQGFDFDGANAYLVERLTGDGHFVAECVHSGGHYPPGEAFAVLWDWLEAHPGTIEESPYAGGLPQSYPDYCRIVGE